MSEKNEYDLYETLSDTQRLLKGLDPDGQRYSLESIMEEFGSEKTELLPETEQPVPGEEPEEILIQLRGDLSEGDELPDEIVADIGNAAKDELSVKETVESGPEQPEELPRENESPALKHKGMLSWIRDAVNEGKAVAEAREQAALREESGKTPAEESGAEPPSAAPAAEQSPCVEEQPEEVPCEEAAADTEDEAFSFESIVAGTVDAVLEETEEQRRSRSLKERLEDGMIRRRNKKENRENRRLTEDPEEGEEDPEEEQYDREEPEPPAAELYDEQRRRFLYFEKRFRLSLIPSALALAVMVTAELKLKAFTPVLQTGIYLALELVSLLIALPLLKDAVKKLLTGKLTAELLMLVSCVAAVADGASALLAAGERSIPVFAGVQCMMLSAGLAGTALRARALRDSFRLPAAAEKPNYCVIESGETIVKRHALTDGFTRCALTEDPSLRWQAKLLPLVFALCVVFAALASIGRGKADTFFWCFSLLLTSVLALALPLCYALPYARIARRLYHSGVSVAGFAGAKLISRSHRMVLTDYDLFPEGTVQLNGIKIFGEEIGKVVTYAASLAHRSGSGISHLFDDMLQGEGAALEKLDEFAFSDRGGVSAVIHGETALLGTDQFLRRAGVTMPQGIKLKNGLFLAVDQRLIAAFAVKYPTISTVEWALYSLKQNRIIPVLASRDPNLTPMLLKQKFGTDARAEQPKLSLRLQLSEADAAHKGRMGALVYREGLMPYAESVIASRRLTRAVKQLTAIALSGSVISVLLCFYLAFVGVGGILTPLLMTVYQLLWLLVALLIGCSSDRY